MNYPLQLKFKLLALGNKIYISDAAGSVLLFAKQKLFKLKEAIEVYADEEQATLKYQINADRIIDFNASYTFTDHYGQVLGSVRRHGMRSLFRASYEIVQNQEVQMTITEENPWTKFLDAIIGEIPLVGIISGYLFHPAYIVKSKDGQSLLRLKKEPSFWERQFSIEKIDNSIIAEDETRILLSLFMLVLLERGRG